MVTGSTPSPVQGTFYAWIDSMPGPGAHPTLIVIGDYECPTTGWTITFKPRSPQGINPKILILETVTHSPQVSAPVITIVPARFLEHVTRGQYESVEIDGVGTIKVKEVS